MSLKDRISVIRVTDDETRNRGLQVLEATYAGEKGWVYEADGQLPSEDLQREDISWFVAQIDDQPVGILRVLYDPPLDLYKEYEFELTVRGLDVEQFIKDNQIAEVGRFAVLAEYRQHIVVVAALMRAASTETVARGYTHYITDVFENDPHSPYKFHTRVMGFQPVATHEVGELNCDSRRITLVLDLKSCYQRLRQRGGWIFRFLTGDWEESLHRQMGVH